MSEMARSIWIGWDPREAVAYEVAKCSLLRRMTGSYSVHKLVLGDLQERGLYTRPTQRRDGRLIDVLSARDDYDGSMSTEHAISRFMVPKLAGSGWALFMDSDVLVRADIAKLFDSLDPKFAVYCVHHAYVISSNIKMDDQINTQYERKNWSSLMIFNCDHEANKALTVEMVNTLPGRDLHRFAWLDDNEIGELDPAWNWLVGVSDPIDKVKIAHFTLGPPDMPGYQNCEFSDEWRGELARLKDGAIVR